MDFSPSRARGGARRGAGMSAAAGWSNRAPARPTGGRAAHTEQSGPSWSQ